AALFTAPTIETLAAVLEDDLRPGSNSSIVPFNDRGSAPPVFLIAGIGGHVFSYQKFARLLGSDQPTFGLKAIGVDGSQPPPERIEAIAAQYLTEICALRPNGPYVLGGFSIGALVAYELACQLQKMGKEVPALLVF